jgi:hypothetical protein
MKQRIKYCPISERPLSDLKSHLGVWKQVLAKIKHDLEIGSDGSGLCLYVQGIYGGHPCSSGVPTANWPEMKPYQPKTFLRGSYYWWQRGKRGLTRRKGVVESIITDLTTEINKRNTPKK